ncbi:MAG: helix-turn-helix domain-containing protein [Polyangiaceae bacterium]|nr:helix-turn-helix domain-containing protein [Polyangiaceae bacterium]
MSNTARKIEDGLSAEELRRAKRRPRGFVPPAMPLAVMRKAKGLTQADVAEACGIPQSHVSRLEARKDLSGVRVETLRRYLEAIGGELELVAVLSDRHRIPVSGA